MRVSVTKTLIDKDERVAYDDSFIQKAIEEKEPPYTSGSSAKDETIRLQATTFPLSKVVNHDVIKQALIVAATNPRLGLAGVLIAGGHGTCKSVLARAAQNLFPKDLIRLKGDPFNIEPLSKQLERGQPLLLDSFLKEKLLSTNNNNPNRLREESIPMPFITVPLNVMEESLLGSVDIEASLQSGQTCFSPGLLSKAHRGILYIDDLNLMEEDMANILMNVLAEGYVSVEREGLSARYPCRPRLVVATYNPNESELRDCIVDRFAISCSTEMKELSIDERVKVVQNIESFRGGTVPVYDDERSSQSELLKAESQNKAIVADEDIRQNILEAQTLLPEVTIDSSQILYLCEEATRAGCEGQRAEIFATEISKTIAALHGRYHVSAGDLQYGVWLAIVPRAQRPFLMEKNEQAGTEDASLEEPASSTTEIQPLEPEPNLPSMDDSQEEDIDDRKLQEDESGDEDDISETEDEEQELRELEIPQEFMFAVDFDINIDPSLLQFQQKLTRKGKGGKRAKIFSISRGRFVKAIFPKTERRGRLAIGATLRAAAPHQILRRGHNSKSQLSLGPHRRRRTKVIVNKEDFRIQRMARKAGTLVIFVVDASGSMALNRMGAAKGAAMLLLTEAYKSRDKIAIVASHGRQAEVLVPPTKSMSMTKNRLESIPCGGASPLAHALEAAIRIGLNEIKIKRDVGRVILVLLTDGRANVPLSVSRGEIVTDDDTICNGISSDRKKLKEEALALTQQLAALPDFDLLCIDTEDKFIGTGIARDIAKVSQGSYYHLANAADATTVSNLVQNELKHAKQ